MESNGRLVCPNALTAPEFKADLSKLSGSKECPADCWPNGNGTYSQVPDGTWVSSQEICYEIDRQRRQFEFAQRKAAALQQADHSPTPVSMYVQGMCSDVQECISRGMLREANDILNDIKVIISERIATKDEHGRHDYAPGEMAVKTKAKLDYLAKRRQS